MPAAEPPAAPLHDLHGASERQHASDFTTWTVTGAWLGAVAFESPMSSRNERSGLAVLPAIWLMKWTPGVGRTADQPARIGGIGAPPRLRGARVDVAPGVV